MAELRVGLLGCGVVGQGVVRLVSESARLIEARLGRPLKVQRVFLRQGSAARANLPADLEITDDPSAVYGADDVDIVVELIGGVDVAGKLVEAALKAKKPVVTANKALLAERAHDLIALAHESQVDLYYEAAVGGGIPVIRTLREALASDRVVAIRAILNGTSNYIVSQMTKRGIGFGEALAGAQAAGYAEADPTLDVGGGDAAHKLALLTTLAFGARVRTREITTEGITDVEAIDIQFARRFGYVFKPLAIAEQAADGTLALRVHPALVQEGSIMAHVTDALNTVHIQGATLGPCILTGPGAGSGPTAVSVVSDLVDVARNLLMNAAGRVPQRAFPEDALQDARVRDMGARQGEYYMRFTVDDKPGVLAEIAGILGQNQVSIAHLVQDAPDDPPGAKVEVVLLTHSAREADVVSALKRIDALPHVNAPSRRFRIEAV
ncbi:MAG: homoserine dehydrogenase [Polyangiales bacterium]